MRTKQAGCELGDENCELGLTMSKNPRISATRPDGGVVTQRTAKPLSRGRNPHFFAMLPFRSERRLALSGYARLRTFTRDAAVVAGVLWGWL